MGVPRNWKSAMVQLLIKDFNAGHGDAGDAAKTKFTIPDTASKPVRPNLAGTVAVTNGSATVTGTGTAFDTDFAVGDFFFIPGDARGYEIDSIASATSLTLTETYAGVTAGAANYTRSQLTNTFATDLFTSGRLKSMYVGTVTDAFSAQDVGLGAEVVSGGLARRTGAEIVTYLSNLTATEDAWAMNYDTSFTATADHIDANGIIEYALGNGSVANSGITAIREVEDEALDVRNGSILNVVLTMKVTGSNTSGTGIDQVVVPYIALREICRLITDPSTTKRDEDGVDNGATNWQNAYTIGGISGRVEQQFDFVAIGSQQGETVPRALLLTDTGLQAEHTTLGGTRRGDGDTDGDCRGSLMQDHLGGTAGAWNGQDDAADASRGNEGETFGPVTETTFAGDTVQLAVKYIFTGAIGVAEAMVTNGKDATVDAQPYDAGDPHENTGVPLMITVEQKDLKFSANGRLIYIMRMRAT